MHAFSIRPTTAADAEGVLRAYHSAVHETAAADYVADVLEAWSPPVTPERIRHKRAWLERILLDGSVLSYVAVSRSGEVLGLGELIPPTTLGALYVRAEAGGQGVATALLQALEARARELGMSRLEMESSLTAAAFYTRRGFRELERLTHRLANASLMSCVRMAKTLQAD